MERKPNIVFILADDMGYGDLSCYGAEKIHTPNSDKIAANGMKFTDAHSSSAVCTPSRYSVITGRYPWRSILPKGVLGGFGRPIIEKERVTIASLLKEQGYATGAFGKWHLGLDWKMNWKDLKNGMTVDKAYGDIKVHNYPGLDIDYTTPLAGGPTDLGFDYWFGISGSLDMPPYCYIENKNTVGIPDQEKEVYYNQQRRGLQTPDFKDHEVDIKFTEKAVGFIEKHVEENPDTPFFTYIATASPHRPCDIQPDIVKGKSSAGDRGDMVMLFDYVVGEVYNTVEKLGLLDNTIFVITSDNGGQLTCANGEDYGHKVNGELRGQKADIWDGGHREPLLVQWPGKISAGSVCDETVCLMDFFATIADLLGLQIPKGAAEDSVSIMPYLKEEKLEKPVRENLVHESISGHFSLRKGDWKYIDRLGSGGFSEPNRPLPEKGGRDGQLYNIKEDLKESVNLIDENPELAQTLHDELYNILSS